MLRFGAVELLDGCLLLALSGHSSRRNNLSVIGPKQTTGDLGIGAVCPFMPQSGQRPMSQHHRLIALGHLSKCQPKPLLWLDQSFWGCMERREFITL